MRTMVLMALLVVWVATVAAASAEFSRELSCISMSDLTSIVFTQSMTQTRRRTGNVPTLQCVGNCPADAPLLQQAICNRQGFDDNGKPTWRCEPTFADAHLASNRNQFGLGQIRVECEGCEKAGDPDVVKGSCVLKYSVTRGPQRRRGGHRHHDYDEGHHSVLDGLVGFIFFAVTGFCLFSFIKRQCCGGGRGSKHDPESYATDANGQVYGNPIYPNNGSAAPASHHHHHYGGGGFGGGGFGSGMLMGYVMGDAMSRGTHYGHGGGYSTYYGEYDGGFGDGGGGGFDAGGFGGFDSV